MSIISFSRQIFCLAAHLAILIVLTGCCPKYVSQAPPEPLPTALSADVFTTPDNTILPLRTWLPHNRIDGVIIAVHGFNDYSNFIRQSTTFLNDHNLAVYSYDQRGFGKSSTRGQWSDLDTLASDLIVLIELVKQKYPSIPVYILGHSMGGAVTIVALTREDAPRVAGAVLLAPAVWARSEMPFYQRWSLWLAAHTIPWKKVTGESLDVTASDNIEMLRELGRDPLVIKETRIDAIYGLSNLMDEAYNSAEYLDNDVLLLYGEKDEIIPQKPVIKFHNRLLARKGHQFILYKNGFHMLLRDLQAALVRIDIVEWINRQARAGK